MRFLPLAALLFVAAAPAKEKKSAKRAVKPLAIAQVLKETAGRGTAWTLDESRAAILGMAPNVSGKKFVLDGSSDSTQHAVVVTLPQDSAAKDLLISSTTAVAFIDGQPAAIDGYTFRADESGNLISGLRAHGKVDEIEHVKLDPASSDVKKRFDAVMATVRNHAALRGAKK